MRLYLAVAVLMLALVAYTEAQEQELTMEQRFNQFRDQMTELGSTMSEKAKSALERFQNSDFATETRTRFQQYMQTLSEKFGGDKSQ